MTLISVIIPCYNEKKYIEGALQSLINQELDKFDIEILIADGMSKDGTRDILNEYSSKHSIVKLLDNNERTTIKAMKLLLEQANGDYIIRADAHAIYPSNYVMELINCLRETNAENVGGVINTIPADESCRAKIIADCLNSRFGVGISFRTERGDKAIEIETVPFGAWRSNHFNKYGPFDDNFIRAQDLEHNIRVIRNGGKILCLPWLKVKYYARKTFRKLWKMSVQYGYWKIPVKKKHGGKFSIRQFGPPVLVTITLLSLVLLPFQKYLICFPLLYILINLIVSIKIAFNKNRIVKLPLYMLGFSIMHYGYGFGYIKGYIDVFIIKRIAITEITR